MSGSLLWLCPPFPGLVCGSDVRFYSLWRVQLSRRPGAVCLTGTPCALPRPEGPDRLAGVSPLFPSALLPLPLPNPQTDLGHLENPGSEQQHSKPSHSPQWAWALERSSCLWESWNPASKVEGSGFGQRRERKCGKDQGGTSESLKHTPALVVTGSSATSSCLSDPALTLSGTVKARAPSPACHPSPNNTQHPLHTHTLTSCSPSQKDQD